MKCEEFESIGLDGGHDTTLSELERVAAREHAGSCPRCAALQDSWLAASAELHTFADATQAAEISPRVELRLRQEFRTQHRTLKMRRTAIATAWALAAAALIVAAVSWQNWRVHNANGNRNNVVQQAGTNGAPNRNNTATDVSNTSGTLVADNDLSDFTLLPGSLASDADDAAIVRVRMQRGSLGALGLPVNEERAADWIQVDLLVGNDGLPQAVRLPQQ